ncbi:hypothetical protein Tco_0821031 [Tanacetum coccineum]|uniref:Uncharacterized protein n=1 Tax=Tanacetum coccineum TaxID=301880 RepID=A0ABQ5AE88_9ASTR
MAGNSFSKSVKKSKSSKQLIAGSGDGSKGSHERAASDVNVSLKTIAGNFQFQISDVVNLFNIPRKCHTTFLNYTPYHAYKLFLSQA